MEQVIFQNEEQEDTQNQSLLKLHQSKSTRDLKTTARHNLNSNSELRTASSNFPILNSKQDVQSSLTPNASSIDSTVLGSTPIDSTPEHQIDYLDHALKLSASYFYQDDLEEHNEAAFYTITTQSLAICELQNNVSHRLRILSNLALYYYTKAAPQLRHLKSLEDVLELSPKQSSLSTYYNNLAFMRLGVTILETEDRETLKPFRNTAIDSSSASETISASPVFSTVEIELCVALDQLDEAFNLNRAFSSQEGTNTLVRHAYYALHNYLIYQASGNHFKAKLNLDEALKAFEQSECNRSIATCHHYLSELYESLGYYTQALEHIKFANRFEAKVKATQINLSELERLHFQYRKKILNRKSNKAHNLN